MGDITELGKGIRREYGEYFAKESVENPKVSIIVPAYNVAEYLEECVGSLVQQTLRDIEILSIDDGSFDLTPEIINMFKGDARVRVYTQGNSGPSLSRNKGINLAKGEYIATLDPDDYYAPNFCEKLLSYAIDNNADMSCCNMQHIRENGKIVKNRILRVTQKDRLVSHNKNFLNLLTPATTNKIMKKEIYMTSLIFKERDIWKDFYQFWRGFSIKDYKIVLLNEKLYFFRQRKSSITHSKCTSKDKNDGLYKTANLILDYLISNNQYENLKNIFWYSIAEKFKKIYKRGHEYKSALLEFHLLADKYLIPQKDLKILSAPALFLKIKRKTIKL